MLNIEKFAKRGMVTLLALFLVINSFAPLGVTIASEVQAATGEKVSYKFSVVGSRTQQKGYYFKVTSGSAKGAEGTCYVPKAGFPSSGTGYITKIPNTNHAAKAAYWLYKNDYGIRNTGDRNGRTISYTVHMVMAFAASIGKVAGSQSKSTIINATLGYGVSRSSIDYRYNLATSSKIANTVVPDNFEVWRLDAPGKQQDAIVWRLTPSGSATLQKSSSNAAVAKLTGYNTFKGIKYDLYKSDKKTKVGTFTCKADGTTNTIKNLAPGTYYAKEVSTTNYYKLNSAWVKIAVKSNQTTTAKDKDDPEFGSAKIIKRESDNNALEQGDKFTFQLVNTQNANFKYSVTLTATGGTSVTGSVEVPAGTYRVTETNWPKDKYTNETISGTVVVPPKGTGEIVWKNQFLPDDNAIFVVKDTEDGGRLDGFKFRVTGVLFNNGTLTESQLINAVAPAVTSENYNAGTWSVNSSDLAALNNAAANGTLDNFNVRLTNNLTPKVQYSYERTSDTTPADGKTYYEKVGNNYNEVSTAINPSAKGWYEKSGEEYTLTTDTSVSDGKTYYVKDGEDYTEADLTVNPATNNWYERTENPSVPVSITAKVYLQNVRYNASTDKYIAEVGEKTERTSADARYTIRYYDFNWRGAATQYKDVHTGEYFTLLTTDMLGRGIDPSTNLPRIEKGVAKGRYTVTEELTPEQAERYYQPESQEIAIDQDEEGFAHFEFENKSKWTDIKLKKISPNGVIEGLQFRLSGTNDFGEPVEVTGFTDEEGNLDFGKVHKGTYVIEELSFDEANYFNTHMLAGYDNPAVQINVTGEEEEPVVVEFENKPKTALYLAKVDGDSKEFLENAEFELYDGEEMVANFQIVRNDDGTAGINMKYAKSPIEGRMLKTIWDSSGDNDNDGIEDVDPADVTEVGDEPSDDPAQEDADTEDTEGTDTPDEPSDVDLEALNWAKIMNLEIGKTYTLKETRTPKGPYTPIQPMEFEFENNQRLVINNYLPQIGTTATVNGSHVAPASGQVTITDKVEYEHLIPNETYTLEAALAYTFDESEEPALVREDGNSFDMVMVDGEPVTATKTFTASETGSGFVNVDITFDSSALDKGDVVVLEECYDKNKQLVATHLDPKDQGQTVHFAVKDMWKIRNEDAPEKANSGKYGFYYGDKVTYTVYIHNKSGVDFTTDVTDEFVEPEKFSLPIVERVENATQNSISENKNLVNITVKAGETARVIYSSVVQYHIPEYLADATRDSDSLLDGNDCNRVDKDNTPDDNDGYVNIAKLTNVKYIDPDDPDNPKDWPNGDQQDDAQTPVQKPQIHTNAIDKETADHISFKGDKIVVIDEVSYGGLQKGQTYVLKGELKNKKTKETVASGETQFVAESNRGMVEVEFTFSSKGNETFVAFEELYEIDGELIATHKDIEDEDQTIYVPEIGTKANLGKKDVVDVVAYKNLLKDRKYVVRGYLVNEKGEKLKGSDGEVKFTAEKSNGEVKVTLPIKFDLKNLAGQKLIAYEECYIIDEEGTETIVAVHKDLKDKSQTVKIPSSTVKTGDYTPIAIYVAMLVMAMIATIVLVRKRVKA